MTWLRAACFAVCVTATFAASCTKGAQVVSQAQLPAAIVEALSWLPSETETVFVVNSPYKFSAKATENDLSALEACSLLVAVGLPQEAAFLEGMTIDWVVSGTRNYRPARGLGVCPFDGVTIVAVGRGEIAKVLSKIKETASEEIELDRRKVFVYQEEMERNTWTYYVTAEKERLLVATDKAYLSQTLAHISSPNIKPVHTTMPLWKYVDARSPLWAVRAFTERSNKLPHGMNMDDEGLRGYAIQIDPGGKSLTIIQSTTSTDGHEKAKKLWGNLSTPRSTSAEFSLVGKDLRITFGPDKEDWQMVAFVLLAAIGPVPFI